MSAITFWPHTRNPDIASFRLRCQKLQALLTADGISTSYYSPRQRDPSILVLSKRYDAQSLEVALRMRKRSGTRLVLDLCDNHFHFLRPEPVLVERAHNLRCAIESVDAVVSSSTFLRDAIVKEVPAHPPIQVIGDLVDSPHWPSPVDKLRHPFAWLRWRRAQVFLDSKLNPDQRSRLVWFGNHGSDHVSGGMNDLYKLLPVLRNLHARRALSLTVISNSHTKFKTLAAAAGIPMLYLPWSRAFFSSMLSEHAVCVIPVNPNPFTLAKTDNRVVTALAHGLNVVADAIPSYRVHASRIWLDDWSKGLEQAIHASSPRQDSAAIDANEVNQSIVLLWKDLFRAIEGHQ